METKLRKLLIAAGLAAAAPAVSYAQSSVTLYGIIDQGINYVSNSQGAQSWALNPINGTGNRFGFLGKEDLGGGLKAVFQLENGFNAQNGTLGQGGLLFGRQAFVGIGQDNIGTLTVGRQYDYARDFLQIISTIGWSTIGHPFDNDGLDNLTRFNNVVKFTSAKLSGFTIGGMYGFSNATNFADNRAWSTGAKYEGGALNLAVSYTHESNPTGQANGSPSGNPFAGAVLPYGTVTSVGRDNFLNAGGSYTFGGAKLSFVYSHATVNATIAGKTDNARFDDFDFGATYRFTAPFTVGVGYTYTISSDDNTDLKPKYNQFSVLADYLVSKRTDVYLLGIYQHVNSDAKVAQIVLNGPSSSRNQAVVRAAIRHLF